MAPKTKAAIFIAITLAWWGLGILSASAGNWLVAAADFLAGGVTAAFAYRSTHPRLPKGTAAQQRGGVKELRAPRPPK